MLRIPCSEIRANKLADFLTIWVTPLKTGIFPVKKREERRSKDANYSEFRYLQNLIFFNARKCGRYFVCIRVMHVRLTGIYVQIIR